MTAYLVEYGRSAFVGRFPAGHECVRGDRVVIRSPRGLEIGTVLCETTTTLQHAENDGELLRTATTSDETAFTQLNDRGQALLNAARRRVEQLGLPLELVDVELSLDERTASLHGLAWAECDATSVFQDLSAEFGLIVRLLDLARSPIAKDEPQSHAGCGKPNCGTGGGGNSCGTGGGCSTGSCSKGKIKHSDELTAYFVNLRQQMEAAADGRRPLV
jgi:cell fate regulator YaaT (PSP1 superfamily)